MPLYRPSELHEFLQKNKASPNKRLSQNFLIDGNIIQKIVSASKACAGDNFLEIGPGPGSLTEALIERGVHLTAVEKDPLFAKALARFPQVTVCQCDILDFPWETLKGGDKYKVAANLPYHLTSPILNLLLPRCDLFEQVTVMVQEEVALRIVAQSGSKDYSALSVFVKLFAEASYCFGVSRSCFYPRPQVNSAVVSFILKKPLISPTKPFLDFIKRLFCHRRKMIRTTLATSFSKSRLDEGLQLLGLDETARPEELSCEQLMALYHFLS